MVALFLLRQAASIWNAGLRQPIIRQHEIPGREIPSIGIIDQMKSRPINPLRRVRSRPKIPKFRIIRSIQCKIPIPSSPSRRINQIIHKALHINRPRVLLPRPSQESLHAGAAVVRQIVGGRDSAIVDRGAGVLIWVGPALGGDGVELVGHWKAWVNVAVLEDDGGIAEDEVDGAVDVTVAIELAEGMSV